MIGKATRWLVLCLPLLSAACAAFPPVSAMLGHPTTLVLSRAVTVPEGRARIYLQDGELKKHINEFRPHCALEIRHVSGPPRTVPAGVYPIVRIQQSVTPIAFAAPGLRLAAVSIGATIAVGGVSMDDGDSPEDIFEGYHLWLQDTANVGLMRLTCYGTRDQPVDAEPPTRAEIAHALGEFGRLRGGTP